MDEIERRLARLEAEAMVSEMLLSGLCKALRRTDVGHAIVQDSFDYAECVMSVAALKIGGEGIAQREKVLQELRAAVLEDHDEPKFGV